MKFEIGYIPKEIKDGEVAEANLVEISVKNQAERWAKEIEKTADEFFKHPRWIGKYPFILKIYCKVKGYEIRRKGLGFIEFYVKNKKVAELKLSKNI